MAKKIKNQFSRWKIVDTIGYIGGKEAEKCLLKIYKDGYWQGVIPALFSLGDMGAKQALPVIERFAKKENKGIGIKAATFYALAKLKDKKYKKEIEKILINKKIAILSWVYLRYVIIAAKKLNLYKLAPVIADYMIIPDYYLQREILLALEQFGNPTVAKKIVIGLKSKFPFIKKKTLKLLRKFTKNYKNKTYEDWNNWFSMGNSD